MEDCDDNNNCDDGGADGVGIAVDDNDIDDGGHVDVIMAKKHKHKKWFNYQFVYSPEEHQHDGLSRKRGADGKTVLKSLSQIVWSQSFLSSAFLSSRW